MHRALFHVRLTTRRASRVPGDKTLVLQQPARCAGGRWYPRGTRLVPLSGGWDNAAGCASIEASITFVPAGVPK